MFNYLKITLLRFIYFIMKKLVFADILWTVMCQAKQPIKVNLAPN